METAELVQTLSLKGIPANEVLPADINDDGEIEYLFLQSPGIYQARLFNDGAPFWDQPRPGDPSSTRRTAHCLTAVDGQGQVIWQHGKPPPYVDAIECLAHVADQMVCCDDLDGDGKNEVALLGCDRLVLLEGATGKVIREAALDADDYCIIRPISTKQGKRLLVKNTERAYPPHWYGDPALIYDADLNLVARLPQTVGSGHSPRVLDINGDGEEELLIGYEVYAADGNRLWRLQGQDPASYRPVDDHVDQLQVGRFGDDREPRIVYAGSRMAYMATLEGKLVWERELGHPQHVLIGNFAAGGSHAQIAFFNNLLDNTIFFLRENGTTANVLNPPLYWPEHPGHTRKAHSGEGILIYPQGCPDGSDAIILRDWGWPRALNLAGEQPFVFPPPEEGESATSAKSPRSPAEDEEMRKDGLSPGSPLVTRESYGVRIVDVDGDGRAEVLIHNLRRAWLFKPPYPKPDAPNTHAKLQPVSGQGFYAL